MINCFTSINKMVLKCWCLIVFVLCIVVVNVKSTTIIEAPKATNPNWWKSAVIYQIYPRTFRDSNRDGVGDLQGIIEKLNYLKETGITAIWLPPIYKGPATHKVDFGYEVVNYEEIDSELLAGSTDFDKLIEEAHKLGIKIILEFVPNHSSIEHPWFAASRDENHLEFDTYKDYYVWHDGKQVGVPPNNWKNHLGQSAWTYDDTREQWYFHQFAAEQPDLNYRKNEVKTKIKDTLESWLEKGVDGFWIDSAPYLVESAQVAANETFVGEYTQNQKETFDLIAEWRTIIDNFNEQNPKTDPRILVTSAKTDIKTIKKYCGEGNIKRAHFTLNNLLISNLESTTTAASIIKIIENWINNVPSDCTYNWVLGNHDLHRVASRFGPEKVDGWNTLTAFLPNIMITYNGEEIGQLNGEVDKSKCRDPIGCTAVTEEEFQNITKDLERTPFHWAGDAANAGFSEGRNMWLPVSTNFKNNNLKDQNKPAVNSHYHTYQDLIKLRQTPGFTSANVKYHSLKDNVLGLSKTDDAKNVYVAAINIGDKKEIVDLSEFPDLNKHVKILVANSGSRKHNRVLTTNNIELEPYESFVATTIPDVEEGSEDWWKHSVIYQIYPLSFKDSDNNGYGDLQGIISKLEHLKDAGISAAWLSPIFKSPQVDQGYDISDFMDIDELYGNLTDFKEMVQKAHELGIKIILDFVPNHSSNQHEWFIKSETKDPEFDDFYIWHNGKGGIIKQPPNNWVSHFKGAAWTWSNKRRQYYLHQFAQEQPDLNYRNPVVVQKMKEVLKFWLDLGVDGFRMDAVPYLYEDESLESEPSAGNGLPSGEYDSLKHIYTSDQPDTFDMIYQWREFIDDYTKEHGNDSRVIMTEAYTDIKNTMKYYGEENGREGAHFTFNFQLITKLSSQSNARDVVLAVKEWMAYMPLNRVANWVLGNHDNHRVASRFGKLNVDGFNMLNGFLPGVMVTYNGEEIGQENGEPTWKDCKDPRACKGKEEDYENFSRDFERTPFHWNGSTNAGFNDGYKPWLPVSKKHTKVNLELQSRPDVPSNYHVYKELVQLRKEAALTNGTLKIEALSDNVLMCVRAIKDGDTYILLVNMGHDTEAFNLDEILKNVTPYLKVVMTGSDTYRQKDELIPCNNFMVAGNEAVVVKYTEDVLIPTTEKPDGDDGATGLTVSVVLLTASMFCFLFMQ